MATTAVVWHRGLLNKAPFNFATSFLFIILNMGC